MSISISKYLYASPLICATLLLAACGGGGGSSTPTVTPPPPPPPPTNTGPTWTNGVFAAEGDFKNRCAVPRTGTNPATGNAYPDIAGSILYENHWLRSWSNNTYLWYSEITDLDPEPYTDPLAYFDILKTTAVTGSGTPKDQFHFNIPTDEYQQTVSSGTSAGYGAEFALISTSVPREIRVAFTEPNSPATSAPANLLRGSEILAIDGVDAVNGGTQADVDVLNAGLFPSGLNESHSFTVRDVGSATTRTFSMTSTTITTQPVQTIKTISTANGPVGYMMFSTFGTASAEEQLFNAVSLLAADNITELVLDLRYNGGGFLDIAGELGYMIAGTAQSTGKTFDAITFNDKHTTTNPVTGAALSPTPFHSTTQGFSLASGQTLPALNLSRVYILSTSNTCSASEAVINGLRGIDVDVVLIGSTTCGKPYGFYATDNCGETYFSIQFKGANDKGFGEYSDGFTPMNTPSATGELVAGCAVADDFSKPLGDETEGMLSAALGHMPGGACPAPTTSQRAEQAPNVKGADATALMQSPRLRRRTQMQQNTILTAPETKN
ncbi:MAG: peptidase [Robiginitomaculum sp.]|nr:MAG: peptidase [Robiginitomaculum sp.]